MANGAEPITNEARDRLLGEASGFLVTIGMGMRIAAERARDLRASAAAICTQINGDLTGSQRDLITHNNYYAAAALGRQVLETTQLIEYFFDNPDRAEFWLTASDEELKQAKDFRPSRSVPLRAPATMSIVGTASWAATHVRLAACCSRAVVGAARGN